MKNIPEAYELISSDHIEDLRSDCSLLIHKKSGAKIALLENDDENKVFYIGFRTPPIDSCGTAHITEHSVLCGSRKYPIKDPFVELAKGSMNTFLNAMTYPDKTVYPIASTNDKDFANLMDVYMDAVLHPNTAKHKEIFLQEGWHYELEDADGDITLNGVVYNEMKGAFSSPDDVLSRAILNSLFPDTTYQYESGGDPLDIPNLTYEMFLDFHKRYYHPSNSYIYLYGDMDMEERLNWLDDEYLSDYDRIDLNSKVAMQNPFAAPLRIEQSYPIGSEESEEDATYLSYNLVIGDILDPKLYQAFELLDYALLSAPGAPIKKALIDAGIGMDILGGYDNGTLQPVFSIIAKGANAGDEEKFLDIIKKQIKKAADGGLDHNSVLAALLATEFRIREADFGSHPKGLLYGLNALDSWLYDDERPFIHLDTLKVLDELKEDLENGYFEELIQKYLLDNSHVSIVVVKPEKGLTAKREEELRAKLAEYKKTLSPEEIEELIESTKHLKEYQATPSTQEELMTLPMLSRSDLKKEARKLCHKEDSIDDIKVVKCILDTHGIDYVSLLFELETDNDFSLSQLAFFLKLPGYLDMKHYDYMTFANEVNMHTGGISIGTKIVPTEDEGYRLFVDVRAKYLYDKQDKAFELLNEMIFETDYASNKRIREILQQEISTMQMRLLSAGHTLSAYRAGSYYSGAMKCLDDCSGIAYYEYIKDFDEHFDERIKEFRELCRKFAKHIFTKDRLLVCPICEDKGYEALVPAIKVLYGRLYDTEEITFDSVEEVSHRNEGITTAAQVQYVSRAGSFYRHGFEYSGAMNVLKVLLNYEYFWVNIRVKGGAYGCMSQMQRGGSCIFSSYRDPNLKETYDIFEKTADYLENFDASERDMTKYVIGAISAIDSPLTPSAEGSRSIRHYLAGVSYEKIQKNRDEIISCDVSDIVKLAKPIRAAMSDGFVCTIGNENAIHAEEDMFEEVRGV